MTLTPDRLDEITVDLIFALRDAITSDGPSLLDFWNGRAASAIETAAAGSESMQQAITTACRKLQIDHLSGDGPTIAVRLAAEVGDQFPQWVAHIHRNIVYIVALAYTQREARKSAKKTTKPPVPAIQPDLTQEPTF